MGDESKWEALLYWAKRVVAVVDLDGEERDYKLNAARIAREGISGIENAPMDWPATLYKALSNRYQNMVDWRPLAGLREDAKTHPDAIHRTIMDLARAGEDITALDTFRDSLVTAGDYNYSPGDIVTTGSLILLALHPEVFAPFKPSVNAKWFGLVGGELPPARSLPSVRYGAFLGFLDEFMRRCSGAGVALRDRLDAQGLMWALTEWNAADIASTGEWSTEQTAAFETWRGKPAVADDPDGARRAWLVRPQPPATAGLMARWFDEGFVSLAASHLDGVEAGSDLAAVQDAVDRGYQHQDYAQRLALTAEYFAFLTSISPGDIVAAIHDRQLHVGVVASDPEVVDDPGSRLRRDASWVGRTTPDETLPAPLPALLTGQGAVVDLTDAVDVLSAYLEGHALKETDGSSTPAVPTVRPQLRAATDALSSATLTSRDFLQELIELLQSRGQFVFFGPPGTGKTYLARKLAEHLVGDDRSRRQLVQFHPSYSYEDFFEGYRPSVTEAGQASFKLQPGPLRRIAADALSNPADPYVLIIDEMNRANIAKVFGELYFLLEYRDATINLQYSPDKQFRLPPNLFVIATMNTADRSIALVDAAIRRRFPFVELHPGADPVRGLLRRFLAANGKDASLAALLEALNASFDEADRDFQIGPSYLMRTEAEADLGLERIWRYDILPLVAEHYYGRLTPAQIDHRFGLAALKARVGGLDGTNAGPVDDDADMDD